MFEIDFIKSFWPLLAILGAVLILKIVIEILILKFVASWLERRRFRAGEKWRNDRELLGWLRSMNPSEFERYTADLFRRLGYTSYSVGGSHDGGIDVVAEKDGIKNYIQCKKFITREVTVGAVRDFYGALADRSANGQGYFITTNRFTLEARKFAEDKPIELVDGFGLIRYIRLAEKNSESSQGVKIIEQREEKCPKCGGALAERSGKFGKFLGCSGYPKCHYTKKL
jgi:restriction system protein